MKALREMRLSLARLPGCQEHSFLAGLAALAKADSGGVMRLLKTSSHRYSVPSFSTFY